MVKIIVYNGYPLSVFVAVTIHILLLAGLLYLQVEKRPDVTDIMQPAVVKALFLDQNPQLVNEDLLEKQRLVRLDQQRQEQQAAEQRRKAAEDLARQQAAAAEAEREKTRVAAERKLELDAQQKRERDAALAKEREQQEENRRREAELAEQRKEQQQREAAQQREREIAAAQEKQRQESAQAASAELARTEYELVQAYSGVIHDLVQSNWSRPPSARNGMTVSFRIRMVPTGDILDVAIVQGSGDAAFDLAAERAINRVGAFRELQGMPINMFNENFRTFLLTFRPEDLLN